MTLLEIVVAVVFVTIGVFASVKVLVRLILESVWLNEIYIRHIRPYFLGRALRREKEHEADKEYDLTKLAQLSGWTSPDEMCIYGKLNFHTL